MKRFVLFLILLVLVVFGGIKIVKDKIRHDLRQPVIESALSPTPTLVIDRTQSSSKSVFIPYWSLDKTESSRENYDQYIYFGITPGSNGIEQEVGSQRVDQFLKLVPEGKETLLTLRMVDPEKNAAVLKNTTLKQKIIRQTLAFAKDHDFSGVVLDLELSAIPFDSLIVQINSFSNDLGREVKSAHMHYAMTLYGDTFYRVRPFDVKALSQTADAVLVMAYDFHKSRANPGPNFPLNGREKYGYDFKKMTEDYLRVVPSRKVSIIFGLFGYDWVVDAKGNAIAQGTPLTYQQIKQQFLDDCPYKDCQIKRDGQSAETVITYTDRDQKKHVVWFEDMESAAAKQAYLKTMGITKFSFWAYSYF